MAFSYTVNEDPLRAGQHQIASGTYNLASVTTGDIDVPFEYVQHMQLQPKGTSALANQPVINKTLPLVGGDGKTTVTIVGTSNETGTWFALGY